MGASRHRPRSWLARRIPLKRTSRHSTCTPTLWAYEIDCGNQTFAVESDYGGRLTWPWSALPADRDFLAIERLDPAV